MPSGIVLLRSVRALSLFSERNGPLPGHAGAFHAKEIEANPGAIRHQPFPIAYENLPGLAPGP
jgi:hypothetical protein